MKIETIEQYEETKITLAKRKLHLDRGTYLGSQVENVREVISHLEADLLQYRREHNIFEVGDLVVNDGLIAPHTYSFKKLMPDISMALIMRNDEEGACGLFRLRHATPEEIQAGRRLEVCGG